MSVPLDGGAPLPGSRPLPSAPPVPAPPAAPPTVIWAFRLYLVAAAAYLLGIPFGVARLLSIQATVAQESSTRYSSEVLSQASAISTSTLVVAAIITLGLIALIVRFAFSLKAGAAWARVVLSVLSASWLFGIAGNYGLGALTALAGAAATVFVWLPASNEWFRTMKPFRVRPVRRA